MSHLMKPLERTLLMRCANLLDSPTDYAWTVQGFGMIRTYLDDEKQFRLNVWDDRLRVPRVSDIHDHPWDFTSWVLVGRITNQRYSVLSSSEAPPILPADMVPAELFRHVQIVTGEGGGPTGPAGNRWLQPRELESYGPTTGYSQDREEVHRTIAMPGTVTINDRSSATAQHTANIYWEEGDWVNAEPRPATKAEVYSAIEQARYQARLERFVR